MCVCVCVRVCVFVHTLQTLIAVYLSRCLLDAIDAGKMNAIAFTNNIDAKEVLSAATGRNIKVSLITLNSPGCFFVDRVELALG